MNKGIFSIPVYDQDIDFEKILNEVISYTVKADQLNFSEAFFGEHITDRHEKITSSLMMVSTLSKLTKNIKLGTLTTNLNFYNPSVAASLISMVDNLTKGRLILGIGSGANQTDIEAIGNLEKNNYQIMLESYDLIKKILNSDGFVNFTTENYKLSTIKTGKKELGLGFFNKLHKNRRNLEVIMPVLNKGSYNVKVCAQNNWSIAISNFCSDEIIYDHIKNYLKYSNLNKNEALKKIKLTKLMNVVENKSDIEKFSYNENSPFVKVISTLYKKLKTYNKHQIFGENVNSVTDAVRNTLLAGTPDKVKSYFEKIKNDYGELGSIIFVTIPKTNVKIYDDSLELFAKYV